VAGLKRFITEKEAEEAESKGFSRIELSFNDAEHHDIPKKKAFTGKWIYKLDNPLEMSSEDGYATDCYAIAQTAKHNFAFLSWVRTHEGKAHYCFNVFPSLEAAAADEELNVAARQAIKKLGVAVEELDI
jgi:hypothetical protein